jgi:hypothetical protein
MSIQRYQYMMGCWADAASIHFDELCKQIREQRRTTINKKLEQMYLERLGSLLARGGPHTRRLGGKVEMRVEV